jgi:predicted TIM-barrel fold metal-dependent hydrolase
MVDFAVKSLGVDRLLFATDTNYESGVGKILAAKLTETERRKVFWDNFNNILRRRGLHAD